MFCDSLCVFLNKHRSVMQSGWDATDLAFLVQDRMCSVNKLCIK